jgi:hypothetical protein
MAKFNPNIEVYKFVPKEKLTKEFFDKYQNDIDLQRLLTIALNEAIGGDHKSAKLSINPTLGTFSYSHYDKKILKFNLSTAEEAKNYVMSMFKIIDDNIEAEFKAMSRPYQLNPMKATSPPLMDRLFKLVYFVTTNDRKEYWECIFKKNVKCSNSYSDDKGRLDYRFAIIENATIKVEIAKDLSFFHLEYNCPILYRELLPATRIGEYMPFNNNSVIYRVDYETCIIAPFIRTLVKNENETLEYVQYFGVSNKSKDVQTIEYSSNKNIVEGNNLYIIFGDGTTNPKYPENLG